MKWKAFAVIAAAIVMCTGIPAYASSLLDNTFGQSEENEQTEGYEAPQVSLHLTEQKILSPAFNNAAVGKTVIPEDWSITVTDLMIGSESITCPNAVMVNVKEVFDAFCLSTSVSAEFEELRNLNSQRLMAEWLKARNSGGTYTPSTGSWDDNESSTVDSGDTYSAFDAWDDYIKDETDYTTGDGSHVKVPSYYDHVFEGEDGTIYAGNSVDGPAGSTELDPTDIGSY